MLVELATQGHLDSIGGSGPFHAPIKGPNGSSPNFATEMKMRCGTAVWWAAIVIIIEGPGLPSALLPISMIPHHSH